MRKILSALLFSLALLSCKEDEVVDPTPVVVVPDKLETIQFSRDALYPEGIAYDASSSNFLVSSISKGTVGKVSLKGIYTPFLTSSKLISTLGIRVDSVRNRVLVAVGDLLNSPGTSTRDNLAAVAIFNLTTGASEAYIDLGILKEGKHLANDIAVDADGNIYITDSFSPIIYKVDATGSASIFLEDDAFAPLSVGEMAGLNGIVFHPDGYLIVSKMDEGVLFKIPVADPANFTTITSAALPGDGLLLTKDNKLVVMAPTLNKAYLVSSTNAWATATVDKTFETGNVWATTMARKDNDLYVLYTNDVAPTPANNFVLQKLKF